jgi:hypothetical protein
MRGDPVVLRFDEAESTPHHKKMKKDMLQNITHILGLSRLF